MNTQPINLQYTVLTTPLPDFIYEGLKTFSAHANAYKPQPPALIQTIAKKHNLPSEMIVLTAGVDEAIQMFALAFGTHTYIFTPTYAVYNDMPNFYANVTPISSLKDNDYSISTDTIPNATLIYLANPNNPSGITSKERIRTLIQNNPQAIVVIDEVYAEFADLSVITETTNFPNLAVFRSFSKSYGMAGNRIGYVVANPTIIETVKTKTQWANVSYLSVGAAITALEHETYFPDKIRELIATRKSFETFLAEKNFNLVPSAINCVLIHFSSEKEGTDFANYLKDNVITISQGNGNSNVGLDKSFVRISIGTPEEMNIVEQVISEYDRKYE